MPDDATIRAFLNTSNALEDASQRLLRQPEAAQQADIASGAASLSNLQALSPEIGRIQPPAPIPGQQERRASFIAQNRLEDAPLDVDTGASLWNRLKSSFRNEPEQKLKFWQDVSPYVRPAMENGKPTGGLIIRVLDEKTEQPKDVLVDEKSITGKDWAEFATSALPEAVGFFMGTRAGKKVPGAGKVGGPLGAFRDLLAGTIGAETIGGLEDVTTRILDRMPIEPGQIAATRAKEGAISIPIAGALGLLGKLTGKVITPFGYKTAPEVQQQAASAQQYFQNRFGDTFPYSAGQKTGSQILQRMESQMERMPGASGGFRDLREQQNALGQRIMNRMIGLPADATAAERAAMLSGEEVGEAGIAAMRGANEPLQVRAELARRKLLERSQQRIEQDISAATIPERQTYQDKLGMFVRNKASQIFNQFKTESDTLYQKARDLPGGTDRILVPESLPKQAASYLEKELPAKQIITEVPTGIVDTSGRAITRTETGREVMKEFIPPDVLGRLKSLASTEGSQWSLQDLIAMRSDVSNAIKLGEAVPGVQTHHLNKIHDMLTGAIKESTEALPDPSLKNAWKAANDYYAKNVGKFHTKLASSMRKQPNEPGYVGPAGLVKRIMAGEDNIMEAKSFLGSGSREYAALKRGIADDLFENSLYPGSGTLNAQQFVKALSDFRTNNRRAFDETFGSYGHKIIEQAKEMILGRTPLAKIDAEAALMGIRNPAMVPRLRDMIDAEKALDKAYQNDIRKAVGSKTMPGDLKPSEFVHRFLSTASPKDAKAAMDLLDPATKWKVRAKIVENLLSDAARSPTPQDVVRFRLDPNRIIASDKLQKLLGDPEKQRVFEAVLDPQMLTDLKELAKLIKPIEAQQVSFRGAAGLATGAAITEFERGGIIPFGKKSLMNKLFSWILTVPGPRWAGNTLLQERGQDVVLSSVMSATPFIESLVDDFGSKGAEEAASQIGEILQVPQRPKNNSPDRARDFLRQP